MHWLFAQSRYGFSKILSCLLVLLMSLLKGHIIWRLRSLSSLALLAVSRRPQSAFFRLLPRTPNQRQASFVLPRASTGDRSPPSRRPRLGLVSDLPGYREGLQRVATSLEG